MSQLARFQPNYELSLGSVVCPSIDCSFQDFYCMLIEHETMHSVDEANGYPYLAILFVVRQSFDWCYHEFLLSR